MPEALAAGWNSYEVVNWHKSCRGIWDIVTEPRIIDVVADLLGDSVILRHSHLFAKLPRSHRHAQVAFRDSTAADNSVLAQAVDGRKIFCKHVCADRFPEPGELADTLGRIVAPGTRRYGT